MEADVGSAAFKAPEIVASEGYTVACDMWSVGVMTHVMVTGIVPWEGDRASEISHSVMKETASPAALQEYLDWFYNLLEIPSDCADFIKGLVEPDPEKRTTAEAAIHHPWIVGGEIKARMRSLEAAGMPAGLRRIMSTSPRPVPFRVVSRLKQFKKEVKLKRTALLAVSFALKRDQLESLSRHFNRMDTDKVRTGSTKASLVVSMCEHASYHATIGLAHTWFKRSQPSVRVYMSASVFFKSNVAPMLTTSKYCTFSYVYYCRF